MFNKTLSAFVVCGALVGGAAFAADPITTPATSPAPAAAATAAPAGGAAQAVKDHMAKETAGKETLVKETAGKESAAKEGAIKESAGKVGKEPASVASQKTGTAAVSAGEHKDTHKAGSEVAGHTGVSGTASTAPKAESPAKSN